MRQLAISELNGVFQYWNHIERFYDQHDGERNRRHTEKWYHDRVRVASILDKLARIEKHALECLCS